MYTMGSSRLIEWATLDGQQLHGALLLPPSYTPGQQYPLIVKVYGGALNSNTINQFGLADAYVDNLQLLASRGYAVLYPDSPARPETPIQDFAKTVLPAVDKVIALGIADPERLGVMGHSYGGYSVLGLIVQTTRFKAAVVSAGPGSMISLYGEMNRNGSSYGIPIAEALGGTPWKFRDRYIENSPLFYLDKVQTPLLLVHSTQDTEVSQFLTDEVFVGLRSLGKDVVYAVYEGESHWQGTWGYANQVDYANRVIEWFDTHLKDPKTRSQPSANP